LTALPPAFSRRHFYCLTFAAHTIDRNLNYFVVMKFENANVLITGGASGIGKIMGRMALDNFTGRKIQKEA
jgi:NADPH:quinone reductase-like Zn-dependent oxidoreductase